MAYEVDEVKVLKLREVFGALGKSSVFVYFDSKWKVCDHSHEYGHACCVNCGASYDDHGASADVPVRGEGGGQHHLVCKRLRRPSDNVMPTPRYL